MPRGIPHVIKPDPIQHSVEGILDYLDRVVPEPAPRPDDTIADIMFKAGRRQLANDIRRALGKAAL